jgi:hypothetical protein
MSPSESASDNAAHWRNGGGTKNGKRISDGSIHDHIQLVLGLRRPTGSAAK